MSPVFCLRTRLAHPDELPLAIAGVDELLMPIARWKDSLPPDHPLDGVQMVPLLPVAPTGPLCPIVDNNVSL